MSEYAVKASALSRSFGGVRAVDSVDLAVPVGEIYAFLGPNGAGKTTVIRMLTTLLLPTSGSAQVAGHDIVREPTAVRLKMGAALQEAALDAKQTGRELLNLQARLYGLRGRVFIHERSGDAFALDIADLFRDVILLPAAFKSAGAVMKDPSLDIERHTRRTTGEMLRAEKVIAKMIDSIKVLFEDVAPFQDPSSVASSEAQAGDVA